jgi:Holliday junction resolvase-like predicted endonuclease
MNKIYVRKANGTKQLFSESKLRRSLEFTGASDKNVEEILQFIEQNLTDGVTTASIYKMAFQRLRKISRPLSAYYGTKRALIALGPDGFLFEKFMSKVFQSMGYETQNNIYLEGKCITHEVDLLAENDEEIVIVECKFHNTRDRSNDIKTALYAKARSDDIISVMNENKQIKAWLVSNTSFSDEAIRYSTCAGLHLWGANFPPQNTLQDTIRDKGLNPITSLSSLKKAEIKMLLESEILLAKDLLSNPQLLKDIGMDEARIQKVQDEIHKTIEH